MCEEAGDGSSGDRDGSAQGVGHDRGPRLAGAGLGGGGGERHRTAGRPAVAGRRGAGAGRAGQAGRPGAGLRHRAGPQDRRHRRARDRAGRAANKGLRELRVDPALEVLRLLCDRRDELSRARVQALGRLHRLFLQLLPGGAPTRKSTARYTALLAGVRPVDPVALTRRRMAAAEVADLQRLDAELKDLTAELKAHVLAAGSHLMDIHGVGPAGAARILADVGDVHRFAGRARFASWTGTAPIDASSGEHVRHRLSRAGNRRLNHVLHIAAVVQLRNDTPGRAYFRRKRAAGKGGLGSIRCLKRRLSDAVYRQLAADARTHEPDAGPGGHCGASLQSSAADLTPRVGTSDQPQPGPAPTTLATPRAIGKTTGPGAAAARVGAPEASTWSAPPDERR